MRRLWGAQLRTVKKEGLLQRISFYLIIACLLHAGNLGYDDNRRVPFLGNLDSRVGGPGAQTSM